MDRRSRYVGLTQHARNKIGLAFCLDKDQGPYVRLGDTSDQLLKFVAFDGFVVLDPNDLLYNV